MMALLWTAPAYAQNTKGDRPVGNQRQVRETKAKSVKKKTIVTRDLAGRRLRTKNKSSANRANSNFPQPKPYANRKITGTDRPAKVTRKIYSQSPRKQSDRSWRGDVSGSPVRRIEPRKTEYARSNVYPQAGPYVNNPSKKPRKESYRVSTRTASNKPIPNRKPRQKERSWRGNIRGGPVGTPSATGSVRNVFPQKNRYSTYARQVKKRKEGSRFKNAMLGPGARSVSGNARRYGNQTAPSATRPFFMRGRKNVYWGKFSKGERAITTDIAGRPLRQRNFQSTGGLALSDTARYKKRVPRGDRAFRGNLPGGGYVSATPKTSRGWRGDIAGWKLRKLQPRKQSEVAGKFIFPRKLSVTKKPEQVGRPIPGGGLGSRSAPGEKRPGRPLPSRAPGTGAKLLSKANFKGVRPAKGGGSRSGKFWNNNGQPIDVVSAGDGTQRASKFQGNVKGQRPLKGGGSVSGKFWNNQGQPIDVNTAGKGTQKASQFQGNIKGQRPLTGGGSVSGKTWNNKGQPIDVNTAGKGTQRASQFQGNIRRESINNFQDQGEEFTGYIKARKPLKGGGSVSGKTWNNNGEPIDVNTAGKGTQRASQFTGTLKATRPREKWTSISGKHWNNKGEPLNPRIPNATDAKEANYAGKTKLRRGYVQNPNAADESLKKQRPDENTYRVAGLQVKVRERAYNDKPAAADGALPGIKPGKGTERGAEFAGNLKQPRYQHNKLSAEEALDGIAPNKESVKAGTYSRSLKMYWSYKQNPRSADEALKVRAPEGAWKDGTTFAGRTKLQHRYKHNANSADEALKAIYYGKAYATLGDYQGTMKMKYRYKHNPNSDDDALKVQYMGKAYARIDYRGNMKVPKYNDKRLHPSAKFAHKPYDNVKEERPLLTSMKLQWAKLFKKNDIQPDHLKEPVRRPRYDKGEGALWYNEHNNVKGGKKIAPKKPAPQAETD